MSGKIIIISAPSGAGKTSIIREVISGDLPLEFSVSACTRDKREGEVHGKDYWFLSPDDFKERIGKGEFLEWEEVYKDNYYGTLKSELSRIWDKGNHVLIEADVYGGINIRNDYPDNSLSIFIMPPSVQTLRERLEKRSTDKAESIETRVNKAMEEISMAQRFDVIIVNDNLEEAIQETRKKIREFLDK